MAPIIDINCIKQHLITCMKLFKTLSYFKIAYSLNIQLAILQ